MQQPVTQALFETAIGRPALAADMCARYSSMLQAYINQTRRLDT